MRAHMPARALIPPLPHFRPQFDWKTEDKLEDASESRLFSKKEGNLPVSVRGLTKIYTDTPTLRVFAVKEAHAALTLWSARLQEKY
jgi:hypothetical protein